MGAIRIAAVSVLVGTATPGMAQPLPVPGSSPENRPTAEATSESSSKIAASWSLTYATRYLFQGFDYSYGKPVLEPELGIAAGSIGAKLWFNHDLDQSVSNEYDLSVYKDWTAGSTSLTTGYTYLTYPHRDWDPTQELYLDISRTGFLNPSLSVHYDFDAGQGTYWTLGASHAFERSAATFTFGTSLFYVNRYYDLTGIPAIQWSAAAERSFHRLTVSSSLSRYVAWENGDLRGPDANRSAWVFTIGVGQEF